MAGYKIVIPLPLQLQEHTVRKKEIIRPTWRPTDKIFVASMRLGF